MTKTPAQTGPARRAIVGQGERALRNTVMTVVMSSIFLLLVVPIVIAFIGSFHNWNPLSGVFEPVGTANYQRLVGDDTFWTALGNTFIFGAAAVTGRVVLGLAIAYVLFSKMTRFKTFFRALFYMPTVTPLVAVAYVWQLMYNPQFGAINTVFGLDINWLYDSRFAMPAIIAMTIWKDFGYAVILFLAGLYAVPEDVLEAAEVDGANAWYKFRYITLPLLKPMTVFIVITSIIGYLQAFVQIMVLTEGGPGTSTQIISFMIYEQAFENYNFGYASAIAFVLLIVTALLTTLSWKVQAAGNEKPAKKKMKRGTHNA